MAFHVCAGDGFLGEETLRFSSGVFLRLFFIDPIWFRLCRSASLVLRNCPCRDFLIRWVIRLGHVSCFHVFEPVIPALEPSAWSLCVLVDVLFRRVVTRRAMRGDVAAYHLVFCAGLWRVVLRRFLRLNNCSVLVMQEF
ncbi:hypothetical protein YC2023_010176 [Brassica napus]